MNADYVTINLYKLRSFIQYKVLGKGTGSDQPGIHIYALNHIYRRDVRDGRI